MRRFITTTTAATTISDILNSTLTPHVYVECRTVHDQPLEDRCDFVTREEDCEVESFVEYIKFMYCTFDPNDQWVAILMSIVWTLILFISLGVAATDFLCPALFMISKTLKMSQSVAGVTLIAFGNGSPDVFAAIAGMMQGRPELVIGALFGGACFVVMIVLGSIFSVKSFKLLKISFLRDITFYAISASWVFYLFVVTRAITLFDGIGLLLFYGLYVALVVCSRFLNTRKEKEKQAKEKEKAKDRDEDHKIKFEGIRPDDDPTSGMVIMKGFVLLNEDGMRIELPDERHASSHRKSNQVPVSNQNLNNNWKKGPSAVTSVSAKIAASKAAQNSKNNINNMMSSSGGSNNVLNQMSMRPASGVISHSVPDIQQHISNNSAADDQIIVNPNDCESLCNTDVNDVESNTVYSNLDLNILTSNANSKWKTGSSNTNTFLQHHLYGKNLMQHNNELTITSMKSVSICEDNNSVYDTITSYSRDMMPLAGRSNFGLGLGGSTGRLSKMGKRRTSLGSLWSAGSRFSLSQERRTYVRRVSREFFEKITPIDATGWKHRNWGGKSMEVIKAPIRFFLLLTTPTVDIDPHAVHGPSGDDDDEVDHTEWNKPLSALHCITGPLFILFAIGYGTKWIGPVPLAVIVFLIATVISLSMILTSKYETPPNYYKTYSSYLGFIVGVVWVYFISTEVVSNIRALGVAFNLSEPTIGMTILALGNCLLDFISNVSIARKGYPRMAISACLGSPLLALLLGVGIPSVIMTAGSQLPDGIIHLIPTPQLLVIYMVIMSSLALTVIVAVAFKFIAKRWYGITLIVLYFLVIALVLLIEFQVIPVNFSILNN